MTAMTATNQDVFTPMGHQQIAPTSSTALTVPAGARFAMLGASVQAVRYTDDGTVPTLVKGVAIGVTHPIWYSGDLTALLFFNDVAGGLLDVLYYK